MYNARAIHWCIVHQHYSIVVCLIMEHFKLHTLKVMHFCVYFLNIWACTNWHTLKVMHFCVYFLNIWACTNRQFSQVNSCWQLMHARFTYSAYWKVDIFAKWNLEVRGSPCFWFLFVSVLSCLHTLQEPCSLTYMSEHCTVLSCLHTLQEPCSFTYMHAWVHM